MDQVLLQRSTGRRYANLREITGVEEQSITNSTTADAIQLLQSLLVINHKDALSAEEASSLTAWERDRMLAVLYTRIYGPRIDTSIHCERCNALFDVDFMLPLLMDDIAPEDTGCKQPDQTHLLRDDISFRLPTGEDECAVFGLPPEQAETELVQRCLESSRAVDAATAAELQQAMQALSPVVNVDLDASCPECGHDQSVQFDLQRYFLTALMNDRSQLMQEVHLLASAYGWSLTEILNLGRSQRRALVALIDADDALQSVRGIR